MNNDLFDLERMLARAQFTLSLLFVFGYFGLVAWTVSQHASTDLVKDLATPVGIIVYYWFQRQRPQSGADGNNGVSSNVPPTKPVTPATEQK